MSLISFVRGLYLGQIFITLLNITLLGLPNIFTCLGPFIIVILIISSFICLLSCIGCSIKVMNNPISTLVFIAVNCLGSAHGVLVSMYTFVDFGETCDESGENCVESGETCDESGENCDESGENCVESGETCVESGPFGVGVGRLFQMMCGLVQGGLGVLSLYIYFESTKVETDEVSDTGCTNEEHQHAQDWEGVERGRYVLDGDSGGEKASQYDDVVRNVDNNDFIRNANNNDVIRNMDNNDGLPSYMEAVLKS